MNFHSELNPLLSRKTEQYVCTGSESNSLGPTHTAKEFSLFMWSLYTVISRYAEEGGQLSPGLRRNPLFLKSNFY